MLIERTSFRTFYSVEAHNYTLGMLLNAQWLQTHNLPVWLLVVFWTLWTAVSYFHNLGATRHSVCAHKAGVVRWVEQRRCYLTATLRSQAQSLDSIIGLHRLCLVAQGGSRGGGPPNMQHQPCEHIHCDRVAPGWGNRSQCSVSNNQSDEKVMHLQPLRN